MHTMIIELTTTSPPEHPATMAASTDNRLAELLHELTDCARDDAGWSIAVARQNADDQEDPLATVARAMVLLRHQHP